MRFRLENLYGRCRRPSSTLTGRRQPLGGERGVEAADKMVEVKFVGVVIARNQSSDDRHCRPLEGATTCPDGAYREGKPSMLMATRS